MPNRSLWIWSGIAGVVATTSYILATQVPWPETRLGLTAGLAVVALWPILSIVYCYGLYDFVAAERPTAANRLGFVFAVVAFTTVLAMIVVQLAVDSGIGEVTRGLDAQAAATLKRGLRLIDAGLDVTWDLLIGTALVFSGIAARKRRGLGPGWAIPSVLLGTGLIVLNVATFPWPPASRGLFDIGPVIGLFEIALAARLAVLGRRTPIWQAAC
jgi:hypothetical protein